MPVRVAARALQLLRSIDDRWTEIFAADQSSSVSAPGAISAAVDECERRVPGTMVFVDELGNLIELVGVAELLTATAAIASQ